MVLAGERRGWLWRKGLFVLAIALSLGRAVCASEQNWQAVYSVAYGQSVIGEMRREVQVDQDNYRYSTRLEPRGMGRVFSNDTIEQLSSGRIDGSGQWQPQRYYFSNSSKPENPSEFRFDWSAKRLVYGVESIELTDGLHDELSHLQLLAQRLASGDKEVVLPVFNGSKRRVYEYRYRVEAEQPLEVPLATGTQTEPGVRLLLTTSRGKYATRFWLAPDHQYVPVRIERTHLEKRRTLVIRLTELY